MCCLLIVRDGEEINRIQLTVEFMRQLGTCIKQLTEEPDADTEND
ncbi:MAG: hypothetical protein E6556_01210 [Pantoea sp.]|nr:hypothetical protein [Pantoea sp.]